LQVRLAQHYISPEDPKHELAVGTRLELGWASGKFVVSEKTAKDPITIHNVHNGHTIHIVDPARAEEILSPRGDYIHIPAYYIHTPWGSVTKPTECTLSTTGYDLGRPMVVLYCATKDDFVGVEPGRMKDINHCPLCGKQL